MSSLYTSKFFKTLSDKKNPNQAQDDGSNTTYGKTQKISSVIASYDGVWEEKQILHLLRRSLFGVTSENYKYFAKLSLKESLDILLKQSPFPQPPLNTYNNDSYTDPDIPYGETWVNCTSNTGNFNSLRMNSLYAWWIGLMVGQDYSLTQKMTLFWHNHIACELDSTYDARSSYGYVAVLMKHALGNYKELMLDITVCPGMLEYLSGNESVADAPNENYSREMQELFTVGKGPDSHYTQDDINAAARILTGWTTTANGMKTIYNAAVHDNGDKVFSAFYNNTVIKGRSGKESAHEMVELIDMIFTTKETARHTCRCIYRWFVNCNIDSNIEKGIIIPLSEILIKNNFEIVPVMRALLESAHFYDPVNIGSQIKNPVDFLVGACRQFYATGAGLDLNKQFAGCWEVADHLKAQAMRPGDPPNVAGWPAYYLSPSYGRLWINSDSLVQRHNAVDSHISAHTDSHFIFDTVTFTSSCTDAANADQLIIHTTNLLSPISFDMTQTALLKKLLDSPGSVWSELWSAYIADPTDTEKRRKIALHLEPFYKYILKQPECHLM